MADIPGPWDWQPSRVAWCEALRPRIEAWTPSRGVALDAGAVRGALDGAARRAEPWLVHPSVHALFAKETAAKNDVQMAAWVAVHSEEVLGEVTTSDPLWVWSPSGGEELEPGTHDLAELGRRIAADDYPLPIALDPWVGSVSLRRGLDVGFPPERLFPESEAAGGAAEEIEAGTLRFLRAIGMVFTRLPACGRWLTAVTRVVVPLVDARDGSFNSSSQPELPGLVFADTKDEAQILEALVHESAHHHLRMAEAGAPLVRPEHQETYASPLRRDPRPLRGIFLAFHALAYICAFFSEARAASLRLSSDEELGELREKCGDAERTLEDASSHLTEPGREFFLRTREVAAHAF